MTEKLFVLIFFSWIITDNSGFIYWWFREIRETARAGKETFSENPFCPKAFPTPAVGMTGTELQTSLKSSLLKFQCVKITVPRTNMF